MGTVFVYQCTVGVDSSVGIGNVFELLFEELTFFTLGKFQGESVLGRRNYHLTNIKINFHKLNRLSGNRIDYTLSSLFGFLGVIYSVIFGGNSIDSRLKIVINLENGRVKALSGACLDRLYSPRYGLLFFSGNRIDSRSRIVFTSVCNNNFAVLNVKTCKIAGSIHEREKSSVK